MEIKGALRGGRGGERLPFSFKKAGGEFPIEFIKGSKGSCVGGRKHFSISQGGCSQGGGVGVVGCWGGGCWGGGVL